MPTSIQKCIEDLIKISETTIWSRDPDAACQETVDALADALGCELAVIHLLDVTGNRFVRCATHSNLPVQVPIDTQVSLSTGRMRQIMATHQPITMDFQHPHPADNIPSGDIGVRSVVSVPLLAGDQLLGIFTIGYQKYHLWTYQDLNYLKNIGRMLGVSVQHAQTARKEVDLAILIEHKRLCEELHDNLSQLVSSLNLGAEAALLSWEEGKTDQLRNDLERIKSSSLKAAQTLREEMLSLRTSANETEGLIPRVRECLERFEQQWGIDTDLHVEGLEPLIVSTQLELHFIRILHESLSNVLRHSKASCVYVRLQGDRNQLCMEIHDDGRGFDPEDVSSEHLGLRIMRERAESLGGELAIESSNGIGTTIHVDVPRIAQ